MCRKGFLALIELFIPDLVCGHGWLAARTLRPPAHASSLPLMSLCLLATDQIAPNTRTIRPSIAQLHSDN